MRQPRIDFRGTPLLFMATDVEALGVTSPRKALEGAPGEMYRLAAAGQAVIGSENFASLNKLHARRHGRAARRRRARFACRSSASSATTPISRDR